MTALIVDIDTVPITMAIGDLLKAAKNLRLGHGCAIRKLENDVNDFLSGASGHALTAVEPEMNVLTVKPGPRMRELLAEARKLGVI